MNKKYKHFYGIDNPGNDYLQARRSDMPGLFDTVYNAAIKDVCNYLKSLEEYTDINMAYRAAALMIMLELKIEEEN